MTTPIQKLIGETKTSLQKLEDFLVTINGAFQRADLSIFYQFSLPPTGGCH